MRSWVAIPFCTAAAVARILFEGAFGELMLWGRCDVPTYVTPRAPIAVTGFLDRSNAACMYCSVETAKLGYRYVEFEVSKQNDMDHIK